MCSIEYAKRMGYVVMRNVATAAECKRIEDGFWRYMRDLNPKIDPTDRATW